MNGPLSSPIREGVVALRVRGRHVARAVDVAEVARRLLGRAVELRAPGSQAKP
jgi:DNA-binding protein